MMMIIAAVYVCVSFSVNTKHTDWWGIHLPCCDSHWNVAAKTALLHCSCSECNTSIRHGQSIVTSFTQALQLHLLWQYMHITTSWQTPASYCVESNCTLCTCVSAPAEQFSVISAKTLTYTTFVCKVLTGIIIMNLTCVHMYSMKTRPMGLICSWLTPQTSSYCICRDYLNSACYY